MNNAVSSKPVRLPPVLRRYAIGTLGCVLAVGLHVLLQYFVGSRIPFLFFLPAIIFIGLLAGRGPAVMVMIVGAIYGAVVLPPTGLQVEGVADRTALLMYVLLGFALAVVGAQMRITSRRSRQQLEDLEQLHDLSTRLPRLKTLPEQLQLILQTLVRLQGAARGLISKCDLDSEQLSVIASVGFGEAALRQLHGVELGEGACGLACLHKERVLIRDTEQDERFARFRAFARHEGFRAVHSTPLLTHGGEVFGAISTHFEAPYRLNERDIRLAELCAAKVTVFIERAQAEALSRERDERFRVVLESSAVPFFIIVPQRDASDMVVDFRWTYVNAAAAHIFGSSRDTLVGHCMSEVIPNIWSDSDSFEHYMSAASKSEVREFELELNSSASFHVVASPLGSSVAVWWTDISDRKSHERGLQEADRRKDEFLAVLAHELRNPLAPIRQAALIARTPAATDEQKRWGQEVIERQVHTMSLLLDDLLDVSRITRGTLQLRKQRALLSAVVQAAVETARPLVDSKRHTLTVECPPDIRVNVDPLRLAQVLSNLLTNAAKYTNPGGVIHVSAEIRGGDVSLSVADNGIGLASDELGSIFAMFSQVRSALDRSEGGLGIGLALTRGLVQLHGGTIEARSDGQGRGSVFTVQLPSAVLSSEELSVGSGVASPRLKLSRRILIADDNRDSAESLAILLRMDGHEVFVTHDGEQAYAAFDKHLPEVALLDIGMPRMSGYELARRIRSESNSPDVLLIAITGWGQSGDRAKAAAAGFDHHLTKPLDYSALVELLRPLATRVRLADVSSVIKALDA
jgi:signal transduction histidine kinase/CheY-like chemotaxis protein